jgi:hypothetical protein
MEVYNSRHRIAPPDKQLNSMIREILGATALAAVSLAERESWGWSLTFQGMNVGFFVGVEPEGMICTRVLKADSTKASVMIQRQKAGLPMTQSHITPRTQSAVWEAVEQYFSEADQIQSRLAIKADGEGVLVQPLPGGDFDMVKKLGEDELFRFMESSIMSERVKDLGEVLIFYECRCSEKMISRMVANMSEADRRELFGDLQQLEIECPRCGRKHMTVKPDQTVQ